MIPLAASAAVTLVADITRGKVLPENLVLLYLLLVLSITVKMGRVAGFISAFVSVLLYDIVLVPPYHSLSVHNSQHLLTFMLILAVSLITSHFVEGIRTQHRLAMEREQQANVLREMSLALAAATDLEAVCAVGAAYAGLMFAGVSSVYVEDACGRLKPVCQSNGDGDQLAGTVTIAETLMGHGSAGHHRPLYCAGVYYFMLRMPAGTRGVLVLLPTGRCRSLSLAEERLGQIAAEQLAMTIERVRISDMATKSKLDAKVQRFRNSLLNSVSHDLRTPLAALCGLSGQLQAHGETAGGLAEAIHRVALRLDGMVSNLLDFARFNQGRIELRLEWQLIDEVFGSAIAQHREHGGRLPIDSAVHGSTALVRFDAVLIERVLCNLLENAERHAKGATRIELKAVYRWRKLIILLSDDGAGIAPDVIAILEQSAGIRSDAQTGLGLSICKSIIDAHGGILRITRRHAGGTRVACIIRINETPTLDFDV